ncbi:MAG: DNA adenine methylase [Candidatus Brocadia sp.]|nr:DNA adenine methylase [Candidatus Brocadia sp.]
MILRSPVNRIGGKYFLRNWIASTIPEHILYCEPFCGVAHLLFSKEPSKVEIINDIDSHLINFFRVIKDHENRQRLVEMIEYLPYSRKLWQEIRENWKRGNIPQDEIERVAQWFYLNRSTYGADMRRGGFAVPSTTGRNPAQSFRTATDTFEVVSERLRNVCIENLDYAECIRRYDSESTLFFIDCPYYGSEGYYGNSFCQDDHYKLSEILHKVKGKVMISHYGNSLYDILYQGWNRFEYSSFKGSSKAEPGAEKPKTIECLWTNFEPEAEALTDLSATQYGEQKSS